MNEKATFLGRPHWHTDPSPYPLAGKIKARLSSLNSRGLYVTVSFGSSPQRLIHIHHQINYSHKHTHHPRHRQRTLQDGGKRE